MRANNQRASDIVAHAKQDVYVLTCVRPSTIGHGVASISGVLVPRHPEYKQGTHLHTMHSFCMAKHTGTPS